MFCEALPFDPFDALGLEAECEQVAYRYLAAVTLLTLLSMGWLAFGMLPIVMPRALAH